jgi:hypothetical protein
MQVLRCGKVFWQQPRGRLLVSSQALAKTTFQLFYSCDRRDRPSYRANNIAEISKIEFDIALATLKVLVDKKSAVGVLKQVLLIDLPPSDSVNLPVLQMR